MISAVTHMQGVGAPLWPASCLSSYSADFTAGRGTARRLLNFLPPFYTSTYHALHIPRVSIRAACRPARQNRESFTRRASHSRAEQRRLSWACAATRHHDDVPPI